MEQHAVANNGCAALSGSSVIAPSRLGAIHARRSQIHKSPRNMSRLPDDAASHRQSAQPNNRRPMILWQPRRLEAAVHVTRRRRKFAALLCALATAAGLARLLWAPSPQVVLKQRPRAPLAAVRARALPLAAVHIVYTYRADCDDDMRGACRASIEAHLDHELPGVPRRSFASLPGAAGVAYHAALEAIASGPDEGYVLVLVPDEDEDDGAARRPNSA